MEAVYFLIIGLIIGIVIGSILFWFIAKSNFQKKFFEDLEDKQKQLQEEKEKRIKYQTTSEEQKRSFEEATNSVKEVFSAAASNALKSNNSIFLDLASKTLENLITESKGDLSKKQQAIEHMIKPLKESLDKHESLFKNLGESSQKTFGNIQSYLTELKKSQENLSKETNALVTALKNPKVRGRWGEIGLRKIVEFSGLTEYCDFVEQKNQNTEEGRLRPDLIVSLPGERNVIVDSKIPLNAYLDALEADEEIKEQLLEKHSKAVRQHMNQLSKKEYWAQFKDSADFVVLYMELESAFGTAVERDKNLILDGINNRVIFATPTTLITLLRTVAYSWKQQAITDNANKIWETGTELYERLKKFAEHLMNIGKGLENSTKHYNNAIGSWENRVLPSSKKLEELGAYKEKDKFPESKVIELTQRQLKD